jgi:cytochrome b561
LGRAAHSWRVFFVLIHVSAALYHHFIRGDSVLKRMLPRAMGGF